MARRGPKLKISSLEKQRAVELLMQGHGRAQVSRILKVSTDTFRARMEDDIAFKVAVVTAERSRVENVMRHTYLMTLPQWDETHKAEDPEAQPVEVFDADVRLSATKIYLAQMNAQAERRLRKSVKLAGKNAGRRIAMMMPRISDLILKWVPTESQPQMLREFDAMIAELEQADEDESNAEKD